MENSSTQLGDTLKSTPNLYFSLLEVCTYALDISNGRQSVRMYVYKIGYE